jgi:integrase
VIRPPRYKLPKFVQAFVDRDGRAYYYFRRRGSALVRLPSLPWSPEFMAAYQRALEQPDSRLDTLAPGARFSIPGPKFTHLVEGSPEYIAAYQRALERLVTHPPDAIITHVVDMYIDWEPFVAHGLAPVTRTKRRRILRNYAREHGHKPIASVTTDDLTQTFAAMTPGTREDFVKAIRPLMKWCREQGLIKTDPTVGIRMRRRRTDGFHTWTEDEIAQFEAHHPIGTKPRLALALLLYTAQRRGDVIRLGRQHIRDGVLHIKQRKTGAELAIPVHPDLREILEATPSEHLTFIVSALGKPFHPGAFSNWFGAACDAAGLPKGCSAHGLRKAACRRLAEAGCTVHQIAAISGHVTLEEVQRYTKAADQARLARSAMATVIKARPKVSKRDGP